MKQKRIFMLFLIGILLLSASNLYADIGTFLVNSASAYEMFIKASHWAVFLAGSVLIAFWKYAPKMKPTSHKVIANARAFMIYMTCSFCIVLILYEYRAIILIIFAFIFEIFDYARESFTELFDYITDL